MINVGIVGYGTIGKRVADAIRLQDDMQLVGVTGRSYNTRVMSAVEKQIPIYVIGDGESLRARSVTIAGTFQDLLNKCDVIVDCTPKKVGQENKSWYEQADVKALYQGGEKAHVADASFVAQVNYEQATGKRHVRVVSCNTTGLSRTLHAINTRFGVSNCRTTLVRRAADANDIKTGPVNAIVPTLKMPSHHGPDVNTILPEISIFSNAIIVPTTLMHLHSVQLHLKSPASKDELLAVLNATPRVRLVKGGDGFDSTAAIMEYAKDSGKFNSDMMDVCIWEDSIHVHGNEVSFFQAVHQESIVVPENIDAIRAIMGTVSKEESIAKTNRTLGL